METFLNYGIHRVSPEPNGAGIFKQYMGARNRVGIGYRTIPARIHKGTVSRVVMSNQRFFQDRFLSFSY